MQMQLKEDDFYVSGIENNNGFHHVLGMHKSARLLVFAKNTRQMGGNCILVDENGKGRYQILDEGQETKIIPAEFVRAKYSQAKYYFSIYEGVKNKLYSSEPGVEQQKIQELQSEIDSHLIRLVKSLIHDLLDFEHIAKTMDNKLGLTIRNVADNNDMFLPGSDLAQNNEWLHLTLSNNSYYLDETALQENDNILYYMAIHKTLNHVIFTRTASPEFKISAMHHLYIRRDDGLGRYKVQTNEGIISKQFLDNNNNIRYTPNG